VFEWAWEIFSEQGERPSELARRAAARRLEQRAIRAEFLVRFAEAVAVTEYDEELTTASNAAVDLVNAGKLEEAEAAARDLLAFPSSTTAGTASARCTKPEARKRSSLRTVVEPARHASKRNRDMAPRWNDSAPVLGAGRGASLKNHPPRCLLSSRSNRRDRSVGRGRSLRGDAGEAVDIFLEVETAIEAPLITGEIPLGVLRVEGATGASNGALNVAKTRVRPLARPSAVRRPSRPPCV
jgi:hypothetical protein